MAVIGNGDDDGVDLLVPLVEHLAEVVVSVRVGMFLGDFAQAVVIDVAERDDVAPGLGNFGDMGRALAGDSDDGDVDLLVGRLAEDRPTTADDPEADAAHGSGLQKFPTVRLSTHGKTPWDSSRQRRGGAARDLKHSASYRSAGSLPGSIPGWPSRMHESRGWGRSESNPPADHFIDHNEANVVARGASALAPH